MKKTTFNLPVRTEGGIKHTRQPVAAIAAGARNWRFVLCAIVACALLVLSQPALASPIRVPVVNLATGIDRNTGQVLVDGAQDPNYTLTAVPAGVLPGVVSLIGQHPTVLADSPPAIPNTYLRGSPASRWLGVINSVFQPNSYYLQQGNPYVIETTVDLSAMQASTAQIDGLLTAVDNKLIGVRVNGTTVFTSPVAFAEEFKSFQVFQNGVGQGLFQPGANTIQFLLDNWIAAPSPAALRVEGQVTSLIPEPSSLFIIVTASVGVGICGRNFRLGKLVDRQIVCFTDFRV